MKVVFLHLQALIETFQNLQEFPLRHTERRTTPKTNCQIKIQRNLKTESLYFKLYYTKLFSHGQAFQPIRVFYFLPQIVAIKDNFKPASYHSSSNGSLPTLSFDKVTMSSLKNINSKETTKTIFYWIMFRIFVI